MKTLIIAIFLLALSSPVVADNELTGPSLKVFDAAGCGIYPSNGAEYLGSVRLNFSNSNTGHVQFKCKAELNLGDPTFETWTFEGSYPLDFFGYPDAMCYNEVSVEGKRAMWIAQCFNAWSYE